MSFKLKKQPPRLANWLASRFIKPGLHEEFFGDLKELYIDRVVRKGVTYAKTMYWVDVFHLLFGFASFKIFGNQKNTNMFQSHLKIAFRNFSRNKIYSTMSVFGLAVGMGICIAICQYIYFELSYDRFHDNYSNIHRVVVNRNQAGADRGPDLYMPYSFALSAMAEVPEVLDYVRVYIPDEGSYVINPANNKPFTLEPQDMLFTDNSFFEVFDFELKSGNAFDVFKDKFNVVITESMAQKYFGYENPIGKTLKIRGGPSAGDYIITGVLTDFPQNSHLQFDFIFPLQNFLEFGWLGAITRYKHAPWFATYFLLKQNADPVTVSQKLDEIFAKNNEEWNYGEIVREHTSLQALADIHLKSGAYLNGEYASNNGDQRDIRVFLMIAVFILIIAWVNYINLSTARSLHRSKEVGVRKSIGALRSQLIGQFLIESFLTNIISAFLSLMIAYAIMPVLSSLVGLEMKLTLLQSSLFWAYGSVVIFIGSLLSGLYPAFVLSSFKPISMLNAIKTSKAGSTKVRKGLIVFQFLISIFLISATYLVYRQITFMKSQELGLNMEKVLAVKGPKHIEVLDGGPQLTSNEGLKAFHVYSRKTFKTFKEQISRHPGVAMVTGSRAIPGQVFNTWRNDIRRPDEPEDTGKPGRLFYAGIDFENTYGIELIAGDSFSPEMSKDKVLINEKAVYAYGLGSPEKAIGQKIFTGSVPRNIVGVVKNFHWQSLRDAQTPMILYFSSSTPRFISIKVDLSNIQETMAHIKSVYDQLYPGNPFEHFFVDDAFNRQYQADLQFGNLFLAFTLLAIFIACIGLFALVSYSTTLRNKEIGIRKVLGASLSNLMMLLTKEYLTLLLFAIVLAIPATMYWAGEWLNNYAYSVGLGPDLFIVPGLLIITLALLTVTHRTYSTAKTNPVDSLRAE